MALKSKNSKLTAFFKKLVKPANKPKKKEAVKMIVKKKPVVKAKPKPVQKKLIVKKVVKKPLKVVKPIKKTVVKKPIQNKLVLKPVKKVLVKKSIKPVKVVKHVAAKPAKNVFTKPKAIKVELAKETKQRHSATLLNEALKKEKPGHKVVEHKPVHVVHKASAGLESKDSKHPQVVKVSKIHDASSKNLTQSVRSQGLINTSSSKKEAVLTQKKPVEKVKKESKKEPQLTEKQKEEKRLEEEKYLEKLKEKRKNQPTDFERYAITDSDSVDYDDYDLDDDEN